MLSPINAHIHSHRHIHSCHTHSHIHTYFLSLINNFSLALSYSYTLKFTLTVTLWHIHYLIYNLIHTLSYSYTRTYSTTFPLIHIPTHTLPHSQSDTSTLIFPHIPSCIHTLACTLSVWHSHTHKLPLELTHIRIDELKASVPFTRHFTEGGPRLSVLCFSSYSVQLASVERLWQTMQQKCCRDKSPEQYTETMSDIWLSTRTSSTLAEIPLKKITFVWSTV